MPDSSEFVAFVAERSGVGKPRLVEQDVLIHGLLRLMVESPGFAGKYLFKGGSCLVKCYYGYYRFSVDLDFSWIDQERFKATGNELQRRLRAETGALGRTVAGAAELLGLDFRDDPSDRRYYEFGGSKRTVTMKLWRGREMIKVQVNFVEEALFPGKRVTAGTLLAGVDVEPDERAYFEEFLTHYVPFEVDAYDEREILCEKVRAILTRKAPKLRDFYDLYVLGSHGFVVEDYLDEIVRKIRVSICYRKYRENLEANRRALKHEPAVPESPFERSLFVVSPPLEFDGFVHALLRQLDEIVSRV